MHEPQPILTANLFAPLNERLIALLRGLRDGEWEAPTSAGAWTVKDVASHLLDTTLKRISWWRDGFSSRPPDGANLGAWINDMNREWVSATRRLSGRMLTDMLETWGAEFARLAEAQDPYRSSLGVSWAGQDTSPLWFDLARELTEKWHHQQQIRDATDRPPLYEKPFFAPVIATFVWGLPHAYRDVDAPAGTTIVLKVIREGEGAWSIVRDRTRWLLYEGIAPRATTTISLRGDIAWRLFTKGLRRESAEAQIEGDPKLAEPLFAMLCIVA
jgi:uncharacterized protein (TIGR03083 family)